MADESTLTEHTAVAAMLTTDDPMTARKVGKWCEKKFASSVAAFAIFREMRLQMERLFWTQSACEALRSAERFESLFYALRGDALFSFRRLKFCFLKDELKSSHELAEISTGASN